MSGNFIKTLLYSSQNVDLNRIIFTDPESFKIETIDHAILFIFATWNAACHGSWRVLLDLGRESEFSFEIYVIDIDVMDDLYRGNNQLKRIPQPGGETYWLKNGRIVDHLSSLYSADPQTLKEFTKNVITKPRK